jgi:glutamate racemase
MTDIAAPLALHALVFDSGVGGLSISAAIRARLPHLRQSYLADDAFRPYGDKSEAALNIRIPSLLAPLCEVTQPDLVVVACNTASTTALPAIRAALNIPVVGVVPAIKPAAAQSKVKRIGVLGTPGTVRRSYVDDLIEQYASGCEVRLQGSVSLVEQAERLLRGERVDSAVIKAEIAPLFEEEPIDAVVLACTHFPLLIDALRDQALYPVDWVDSGDAVARRVESLLSKMKPKTAAPSDSQTAFLTGTDQSPARAQTFKTYGFDRIVSLPDAL